MMTQHVQLVMVTPADMIRAGIDHARELSLQLVKLANLDASPLNPGETADARRHVIAKLGKMLAEAFLAVDTMVKAHEEMLFGKREPSDVPTDAPPIDPNTDPNSN